MSGQEESLFLKKDGWIKWVFWIMAIICIGLGSFVVYGIMKKSTASEIPMDYIFAVLDDSNAGSGVSITYYVYNDKIIAKSERNIEGRDLGKTMLVSDEVDTSGVVYDESDATEVCPVTTCTKKGKTLKEIKKIIANKVGREYIGR